MKMKRFSCKKCGCTVQEQQLTATGTCNVCMDLELRPVTLQELQTFRELYTRIRKHAEFRARRYLHDLEVQQDKVYIRDDGRSPVWDWAPNYCWVPIDIFLDAPEKTHEYRNNLDKEGEAEAIRKNQEDAKRLREEQAKRDEEQARKTMKQLIEKYPGVWAALA